MRWQQLFADLSAQLDHAEADAERSEAASRARAEFGAVRLADRLRGSEGSRLSIRCRCGGQLSGTLADVGADWFLLEDDLGADVLVATAAVVSVGGLGRITGPSEPPGVVRSRLDLRWAIRALARDRAAVQVALVDGSRLSGTVDRVGADFVELAEHPVDSARRPSAVRGVQAVALSGIATVRTAVPRLD